MKKNKGEYTFTETDKDITQSGADTNLVITKPIYRNLNNLRV